MRLTHMCAFKLRLTAFNTSVSLLVIFGYTYYKTFFFSNLKFPWLSLDLFML